MRVSRVGSSIRTCKKFILNFCTDLASLRNATLTGGQEYLRALNKVKPIQVWNTRSDQFGGSKASHSGKKPHAGGFDLDVKIYSKFLY